jgi:4-hydroxybenzoate polyprenyltransferase
MTLAPVGGFVGGWMIGRGTFAPNPVDVYGTVAMLGLAVGALAYNGYEDRVIDARKETRFALEHPGAALLTAGVGYAITFAFAATLPMVGRLGFLALSVASILYSRFLVYVPGVKNLAAAAMSGTFVWLGGAAGGSLTAAHAPAALTAFFGILAMVLVEDVEDQPVDRGQRTTLAMVLTPAALKIIVLGSVVAALLSAARLGSARAWFLVPYVLAALAFVPAAVLLPNHRGQPLPTLSRWLVWNGLWVGLVALVAGVIAR